MSGFLCFHAIILLKKWNDAKLKLYMGFCKKSFQPHKHIMNKDTCKYVTEIIKLLHIRIIRVSDNHLRLFSSLTIVVDIRLRYHMDANTNLAMPMPNMTVSIVYQKNRYDQNCIRVHFQGGNKFKTLWKNVYFI